MPYDPDFDQLLWDTVTIDTFSTVSAYGTASYSTDAKYYCLVERGDHKVLASDGQEVVARTTIYIGQQVMSFPRNPPPTMLSAKDRVTLSTVWSNIQPRILAVEQYGDGESSGRYMTVVHCD